MEKDHLSRWLSVGANLAVLVGLIFVAMEVRQSRNAGIVEAADGIADGFLQLSIPSLADSNLARLWVDGMEDPDQLSDAEAIQFSMKMRVLFNQIHRVNRLCEAGFISEPEWAVYAREAAWIMDTPGGRAHWEGNEMVPALRAAIEPYVGQDRNIDFRLGRGKVPPQ